MNIRKIIYDILNCTACAFTVQILSFILLPEQYTPVMNRMVISQTFVLALLGSSIAVLVFKLDFKNIWIQYALSFFSILAVLIVVGSFIFHLIPLELPIYASVIIILLLIFLFARFLVFDKNKNDAEVINQGIHAKRRGNLHG